MMKDRSSPIPLRRTAMLILTAAVVAAGVASARADDFEESRSPWAVAPPIGEKLQPGVQRDGTLRVIRFSNDRKILSDPGTVVGFTAIFARTGELSPTHPYMTDQKSILEIMHRSGVKRAELEQE
jgi:hypothetical protein